jgi:hypothetical protein
MDSILFDPKDIKTEQSTNYFSFYILLIAGIAMFSILYQKSTMNITDLYEKIPNPIYLVIDQIKTLLFSFNKPTITKNSIKLIRYSYELPKSLDFLYR